MAGRNAVLKWREDNCLENGGKTINEILIARHLLLLVNNPGLTARNDK
jgi:hypothetical protein